MKTINTITKTMLLVTIVSSAALANSGNEKGNGGFLYSRTSKVLLDKSIDELSSDIQNTIKSLKKVELVSDECPKPIDLERLNAKLADLSIDYNTQSTGLNPDGHSEPRYFHINQSEKIEPTLLFYSSFVDTYFRYAEEKSDQKRKQIISPIKNALIHESLHLFGYNELEARTCSQKVQNVISDNGCDRQHRVKRSATAIINFHLPHVAAVPGTKLNFTTEEIFENKDFKNGRDLLDNLFSGQEFQNSRKSILGSEIIFAIIRRDVLRNMGLLPGENLDTPFSKLSCQ